MKNFIFYLLVLLNVIVSLSSCGKEKKKETIKDAGLDELEQVYEESSSDNLPYRDTLFYYYQHSDKPSFDDAVFAMICKNPINGVYNENEAYYYGNTDDTFCDERSGYLPGFFGIRLHGYTIQYKGKKMEVINYEINLEERMSFDHPVVFPISDGEMAMRRGYKPWFMLDYLSSFHKSHRHVFYVRHYEGWFVGDDFVVKCKDLDAGIKERRFKKVSRDFVEKNYTRSLVPEKLVGGYFD